MIPTGRWVWWNQFGSLPLAQCVSRAKQVEGVIVKALYWPEMMAFMNAGISVGVERYTYPSQPKKEAGYLAEGIRRGAKFVVINAEIEWERAGQAGGRAMAELLNELERLVPGTEVYASVDTRGQRTHMSYQQVLGRVITGWMPMIYPKAFFPNGWTGHDWINQSFINCLETGQDFQGKPVLPTLQTYDNIGRVNVRRQIGDATSRNLMDIQAYTVCHATDDEWEAWIRGQVQEPVPPPQEDDMKVLVWYKGYYYQERWNHHWHVTEAQVNAAIKRGWPAVVSRKPKGSRSDF